MNELGLSYAGFWRRLGAYLIDVIIFVPYTIFCLYMGGQMRLFQAYFLVPSLLIGLFFHVYLVKRYGGTPGKLIAGIRIRRVDGSPVGYREAILRHALTFLLTTAISVAFIVAFAGMTDQEFEASLLMGASFRVLSPDAIKDQLPFWYAWVNGAWNIWIWSEFIVMLTNKRRRALHDFMAGTVVLKHKAS